MAALTGTAGSVVYTVAGTTEMGGIAEWSLDMSHSPVETTAFGDNWQTYVPSLRGATGSFSGNFDHANAVQQNAGTALMAATAISLHLFVDGTKFFDIASAYVTGWSPSISQAGKGDVSFDFTVNGAVLFA